MEHHTVSLALASQQRKFSLFSLYILFFPYLTFPLVFENDSLIYKDLQLDASVWSLWAEWLYCKPFLLGSIISICPYWNAPRAEKLKSTSGQSSFDKGEDILPGTYQNSQRILLNKLTIKTVVDVLHGRVNIVLNF